MTERGSYVCKYLKDRCQEDQSLSHPDPMQSLLGEPALAGLLY